MLCEYFLGDEIVMSLNEWKYKNPQNEFLYLEDWMNFSLKLANYVKIVGAPIKIYISVPSNLLFSYFFAAGAIDYDFKNPSKEALLERYLSLQKGQRILYKRGEKWVAHSVLEVSRIPNAKTRAIVVKDRLNTTSYIPEARWFDYVRIHENEVTEVRNIRRVRNVESIKDNFKLKKLYSEYNLNLLMMQNTPKTYLYANKKEWKDNISVIEFEINKELIQLDELLFDGIEGSFKNLPFIQQTHSMVIPKGSTIIFVGSSRTLRKMTQFEQQKCVYIIDQHDSSEKLEELQLQIEQQFLMEKGQSLNKEILDYMNSNLINIPRGVEIFAWVSKS